MHPSAEFTRARWAVTLMFILNGVGWASLLPRYPELKQITGLGDFGWGAVIALGPLGGLITGLFTARLMRRFHSPWVWLAATLIGLACLNLSGNASHWVMLAAGIGGMAAMDSIADIAMNAHGLRVQKGYGRSILNGLHGWWSVGAVVGGFLGSIALQGGVPIWVQTAVASVLFGALALVARSLALRGPDASPVEEGAATPTKGIPRRWLPRLIALGLLGASAGLIEDSGASWGAVYMDSQFTVEPFWVGMAFVALQVAQMIGRFTGDALTNRIGARGAVTQGFIIAALGMAVAVVLPTPATTILGFACAGWGIATAIPGTMHAADELPGMLQGNGLTFVTWLMRLGFFVGPPLIGLVAQAVDLRWALIVIPAAALLGLLLTPALTLPEHEKSPAPQ
ncbi:MFS transporter [Propioniciclava soli]|uniref:MFS transporter n=1 Tax=Propioniciclava soli TaxID=2775081 RepID=A0ABZ3CB89_9ACTN